MTVTSQNGVQSADVAAAAGPTATSTYHSLKALVPTGSLTGNDLGGQTIYPRVYHRTAALAMTTPVTFDAKGDPNAIFIIQSDAAMNTIAGTTMNLINGADETNIYWVTTGAVTLGASSTFEGNILAYAAVTVGGTSTIDGRAISISAAINLSETTINHD